MKRRGTRDEVDLRKIPVRAGGKKKVYLSISHNEWVPASEATEKMGFARPHSIVNLGLSERLDAASLNELLAVAEPEPWRAAHDGELQVALKREAERKDQRRGR